MPHELEYICAHGLGLFSVTNRWISHELKNVLAILSETLGLMEELMELSPQGAGLSPDRLKRLSQSMMEEVDRANGIIRNMNTFAHSVDAWITTVDLGDLIKLMIDLCHLDSALRKTQVELDVPPGCVIETGPFFLADLIGDCLNVAMRGTASGHHLVASVAFERDRVRLTLSGLAAQTLVGLPSVHQRRLAEALAASVSGDIHVGALHIVLPQKLPETCLHQLMHHG